MKKRVVCKVCGYVMDADKLGDKCPACGVAAKAFQEFVPTIAPKRELWLSFDLHPVIVHFPVAFSVTVFLLAIVFGLTGGGAHNLIGGAVIVLAVCLPFTVVGGMVTGLLDGNVRFKKINTPLLIRKIVLGVFFFVFSAGMIVVAFAAGIETPLGWLAFLACNLGAVACAVFLGLIGSKLVPAKMPN
jgi:hypothetical protein